MFDKTVFFNIYQPLEGQYGVYKTDNPWVANQREGGIGPVKIIKAHENYVLLGVVNDKGELVYRECCNYTSLNDNGDKILVH